MSKNWIVNLNRVPTRFRKGSWIVGQCRVSESTKSSTHPETGEYMSGWAADRRPDDFVGQNSWPGLIINAVLFPWDELSDKEIDWLGLLPDEFWGWTVDDKGSLVKINS